MKPALMFAKAVDHQLKGEVDDAKVLYKKLLRTYPDNSEVLGNLAVLVKKDGQVAVAEQMLRRALSSDPRNFAALTTMANIHIAAKRFEEAAKFNDEALRIEPHFPDALVNQGVILIQNHKLDQAQDCFWRAMQLDPSNGNAKMNFANVRRLKRENIQSSIDMLASVAEQDPGNVIVRLMLSAASHDAMRYVRAINFANEAVRMTKETEPEPLNALATAHVILGELEEAIDYYTKARTLAPNDIATNTGMLFAINYDDRLTPEQVFHEYKVYAAKISGSRKRYTHTQRPKIENRRIRIAYSSPDLYSHVVSFFIEPILRNHDRTKFEIIAYANVVKPDEHTVFLKRYFDKWVDVVQMSDAEVAERIYNDGVDILVDLAGHTYGNRLSAMAMKPAPIQATYLGFGYTTGMNELDYFIGDENFAPVGSEPYFSEKILRIEAPVYAYNPPRGRIPPLVEPPALTKGYVTFGTMSRMIRLNNRLLAVWKQILDRVPGSKLRFDQKTFEDSDTIERFYQRLESLGYDRSRVELVSTAEHWNGYHQFDIALDCWPHNAGTTTFEALFSGVPVIAKRDRVSVGRLSDMVLNPLGLGEWVVDTEAQFVDKAVEMASDLDKLTKTRAGLRKHLEESPFFDFKARTRGLEAGYMEMVRRYNAERS